MKSAKDILITLDKRKSLIQSALETAIEKKDTIQQERNKARLDEVEKIMAYIKKGDKE